MRILIFFLILLLTASCTNKKVGKSHGIIKYSQQDSMMYKFVALYNSYTDATFEWHRVKDFSITIHTKRSDDTLKMYFYGNTERDITTPILEDCKFCYFVNGHYVFAQESIFSFAALNIDSVYKKINPNCYSKYLRKEIIPPPDGWDSETLFAKLVNNELIELKFGFDKDMYKDFGIEVKTANENGY